MQQRMVMRGIMGAIAATALVAAGCSGGGAQQTGDDPVLGEAGDEGVEATGTGTGTGQDTVLLARCKDEAAQMNVQTEALRGAAEAGTAVDWTRMEAQLQGWHVESHACLTDGPDAVQRRAIHKQQSKALHQALYQAAAKRAATLQASGQPQQAWDTLRWAYIHGAERDEELQDLATGVEAARVRAQLATFVEQEGYGKLSDKEAVCIFAKDPIDPTSDEIVGSFQYVFEDRVDVHALCRTPRPVDEYAVDGDGELVLVLRRDDVTGRLSHEVAEVKLGTLGKWPDTQYFRGRFSMPQGITPDTQRSYYHVTMELRRPGKAPQQLTEGGFLWHR